MVAATRRRSRRTYGSVRQLPSGRWQARIPDEATGKLVPLGTFAKLCRHRHNFASRSKRTCGGPPKSKAGYRTIAIAPSIISAIREHLEANPVAGMDSLIFRSFGETPMRRATLYRSWKKARTQLGVEHFHFHDLRRTGQDVAVDVGAGHADLMKRMDHSSVDASMRYMFANPRRDLAIAEAIEEQIQKAMGHHHARVTELPASGEDNQ